MRSYAVVFDIITEVISMSRICENCGKTKLVANVVQRDNQGVHSRTSTPKKVNLQSVTVTDENGRPCKMKLCTRCIKKMKSASN
jgi:ribosomal protein L28